MRDDCRTNDFDADTLIGDYKESYLDKAGSAKIEEAKYVRPKTRAEKVEQDGLSHLYDDSKEKVKTESVESNTTSDTFSGLSTIGTMVPAIVSIAIMLAVGFIVMSEFQEAMNTTINATEELADEYITLAGDTMSGTLEFNETHLNETIDRKTTSFNQVAPEGYVMYLDNDGNMVILAGYSEEEAKEIIKEDVEQSERIIIHSSDTHTETLVNVSSQIGYIHNILGNGWVTWIIFTIPIFMLIHIFGRRRW